MIELTERLTKIRQGADKLNFFYREKRYDTLFERVADLERECHMTQYLILDLRGEKSAPDESGKAAQP